MESKIKIIVDRNFPNRFNRQLIISCGNAEIKSLEFDSRSDDAKVLALELIFAAQQLLAHHQLNLD